jgi:hypothetical protein
MFLSIQRDLTLGTIKYAFTYKNIITINAEIISSLQNKPLRVINPINFDRWSYTDKRPGLKVQSINVTVKNQKLQLDPTTTLASTD